MTHRIPQASAGHNFRGTTETLPATSPLSGVLWTWVVPVVLFSIAFVATWLLYRHFAQLNTDPDANPNANLNERDEDS